MYKNQWTNKSKKDRIIEAVAIECDPGIIYSYNFYQSIKITLPNDPCWIFRGHVESNGYTRMTIDGKRAQSHRHSWEIHNNAKIPKGLVLDHLCLRKDCLNPKHLELVTPIENDRRARFHYEARKKICNQGHELVDPNIIYRKISQTRIDRRCRICTNIQKKLSYHKNKELTSKDK